MKEVFAVIYIYAICVISSVLICNHLGLDLRKPTGVNAACFTFYLAATNAFTYSIYYATKMISDYKNKK